MPRNFKKEVEKHKNISYINKDFKSMRNELKRYIGTHFSDTIVDISDASLAGMLVDLAAYVGDVMSYYIDHQFNETSIETAVEDDNIERFIREAGVELRGPSPAIAEVTFRIRVGDEVETDGGCAIGGQWLNKTTDDYFAGKRVVLFSLPGAFTPTCSSLQLPSFEKEYGQIKLLGIDEVYCVSVNDSYVMNAWAKHMNIESVKMIPDGSGNFTRFMGMLVGKNHLGFGNRSWRYMAVINDGVIERWWQEPGINNEGLDDDPYVATTPNNVIDYLRAKTDY